jgi:hypothetical protein
MEDAKKVQAKVDELSKATGHAWRALPGNHAMTKVVVKSEYNFTFIPDAGMPVKIFVDLVTGEVRTFMYFVFEVDSK